MGFRTGGGGGSRVGFDYSSATPGNSAQIPDGFTYSRASTQTYVRATVNSLATLGTPAPTNVPLIGGMALPGLCCEPAATSLLANGRALNSWTQDATTTTGQPGPDGNNTAFRVAVTSGVHNGILQGYTQQATGVVGVVSVWVQQGTSSNFQLSHAEAATQMFGGASILSASWQSFSTARLRLDQNASPLVILGEVQDLSTLVIPSALPYFLGPTAGATAIINPSQAENFFANFAMLETGASYASTYVDSGTPRAAGVLSCPAAQVIGSSGTIEFEVTFCSLWTTAQLQASTTSYLNNGTTATATIANNPCLFYRDALTYCEYDVGHGQVRLVVGGSPVVFPTVVPVPYGSQSITIHVRGGAGAASGWYQIGSGARVDLGTEAVSQPPAVAGGATMYLFGRSTAGFELGGYVNAFHFVRS